jgi:hypothetical protein
MKWIHGIVFSSAVMMYINSLVFLKNPWGFCASSNPIPPRAILNNFKKHSIKMNF